jgi:hypothetical protein
MKSAGSNAQLIREVIAMSDVARRDDPAQREAVQEFPRRDPRPYRRPPEPAGGETFANQASSIVQRVAVTSVSEIDRLIAELETLREFLRQEGVRIQREIDGYARLSEEAVKSTKIIGESVNQWKTTLANLGGRR